MWTGRKARKSGEAGWGTEITKVTGAPTKQSSLRRNTNGEWEFWKLRCSQLEVLNADLRDQLEDHKKCLAALDAAQLQIVELQQQKSKLQQELRTSTQAQEQHGRLGLEHGSQNETGGRATVGDDASITRQEAYENDRPQELRPEFEARGSNGLPDQHWMAANGDTVSSQANDAEAPEDRNNTGTPEDAGHLTKLQRPRWRTRTCSMRTDSARESDTPELSPTKAVTSMLASRSPSLLQNITRRSLMEDLDVLERDRLQTLALTAMGPAADGEDEGLVPGSDKQQIQVLQAQVTRLAAANEALALAFEDKDDELMTPAQRRHYQLVIDQLDAARDARQSNKTKLTHIKESVSSLELQRIQLLSVITARMHTEQQLDNEALRIGQLKRVVALMTHHNRQLSAVVSDELSTEQLALEHGAAFPGKAEIDGQTDKAAVALLLARLDEYKSRAHEATLELYKQQAYHEVAVRLLAAEKEMAQQQVQMMQAHVARAEMTSAALCQTLEHMQSGYGPAAAMHPQRANSEGHLLLPLEGPMELRRQHSAPIPGTPDSQVPLRHTGFQHHEPTRMHSFSTPMPTSISEPASELESQASLESPLKAQPPASFGPSSEPSSRESWTMQQAVHEVPLQEEEAPQEFASRKDTSSLVRDSARGASLSPSSMSPGPAADTQHRRPSVGNPEQVRSLMASWYRREQGGHVDDIGRVTQLSGKPAANPAWNKTGSFPRETLGFISHLRNKHGQRVISMASD